VRTIQPVQTTKTLAAGSPWKYRNSPRSYCRHSLTRAKAHSCWASRSFNSGVQLR